VKNLFIFAGANGSGKTTLYKRYEEIFRGIPYVNADELLKSLSGKNDPQDAQLGQFLANEKINQCLLSGESLCFETVFSHESKIALIERAKILGYRVTLYFTHLGSADENVTRVEERVKLGGHHVPENKIRSRIPRTLENVKKALKLVDDFYLFDNQYVSGHQLVAYKRPEALPVFLGTAPNWVKDLLNGSKRTSVINKADLVNVYAAAGYRHKGVHKKCARCGRFLRGKRRPRLGICSRCEPKIR